MYPDQSLYPANSVPLVVKRINNTLLRADQLNHAEGDDSVDYLQPIVADAEAGFGGVLNAFELMKSMIEAGAAGRAFRGPAREREEVRPHGRQGARADARSGREARSRRASRPTSCGVPTLLVARTDAEAADLLTSDIDAERQPVHDAANARSKASTRPRNGLDQAISRGLAYAPYADLVWCETGKPDLEFARAFAEAIHAKYPGQDARLQLLAELQLEEESRRRDDRASSRRKSRATATSSSSSRWPASTRSTTRCSTSRTAMRAAR